MYQVAQTNFFWHLSDDDRIKYNSIEDINQIIKNNKNISGITINHEPKWEIKNILYKNKIKNLNLENFDIFKNAYKLGLSSAQIYNTKKFIQGNKITSNYFNDAYYHIGIILHQISSKKKWKYLNNKMIIYRNGIIDYKNKLAYLKRLDDEFKGYLKPINILFKKKDYKIISRNIFYKNIMSWIYLNIRLNGKNKTFKILLKNLNYLSINIFVIILLIVVYFTPLNVLKIVKNLKVN